MRNIVITETCATCKFSDWGEDRRRLKCCRWPPTGRAWPEVYQGEWCGEFIEGVEMMEVADGAL
jgi:hypothetical protein